MKNEYLAAGDRKYATVMSGMNDLPDSYPFNLIGEDETTFSAREAAAVEEAMSHGQLYYAEVEISGETLTVSTDLSNSYSEVKLSFRGAPLSFTVKKALEALRNAVELAMFSED